MQTLFGDALRRRAVEAHAHVAILSEDLELRWPELDARTRACASWLRADGLAPREVVGVTIADETAHLVVSLALLALGVPQVTLASFDPPALRRSLAKRLRVTRIVTADPSGALAGVALSLFRPDRREDAGAHDPTPVDADPDAIAFFCTSSGTTGEPKIIPMSQRLLAMRHARRSFEDGERMLLPASVEHVRWKLARLASLWRGCTSVFARGAAPTMAEIAAACARHAVTRIDMGVLHLANLLQSDVEALPATLKVFASGSRVPMRMRDAFRARTRARLYVEYGARETGAVTSTWPVDRDAGLETVGPPLVAGEVQVVGPDGQPVALGEVGEIRVRYEGMLHGYHDDPAATARHFRDGWFHPGDLGSMTPNGSMCLAGRTDDVMNLNGIKVYPSEIERVLEDEPGVRVAAAFAIRSDLHGQIPMVAVEWNGPVSPDPLALQARARARLGIRAPRKVMIVDELPRNAGGKVAKAELAKLAEAAARQRKVSAR